MSTPIAAAILFPAQGSHADVVRARAAGWAGLGKPRREMELTGA